MGIDFVDADFRKFTTVTYPSAHGNPRYDTIGYSGFQQDTRVRGKMEVFQDAIAL